MVLVVAEKKFNEVKSWFTEHFKTSDRRDYLRRSPFVILSGPTGSGKTFTLERIAEELGLSIKEYSETTDTSLIQFELKGFPLERDSSNTTLSIDRRRSLIFESFVINNIRYETLYADHQPKDHDDAADEFDDDDDFIPPPRVDSLSMRNMSQSVPRGLIIHIESPLTFGRTTPVLIQCLRRLKKIIKEIARQTPRRVAIVFEAVDGNDYMMSLSSCVKQSLDIEVFKFNPVTRMNMKKFIISELGNYSHLIADKVTLEQLIDDCNGDISACKNTLRLLCNQRYCSNLDVTYGIDEFTITPIQPSKRQKIDHFMGSQLSLHPKLMRDISRGSGFFHILGKIFYQKRLYPETDRINPQLLRSIDRPYAAENSTEHLVNQVDSESRKLNAWLHQNYMRFCESNDIEKAALFMENLSFVDTMSLDSTQSTQYYENHKSIDLLQKHVAIESTVFSLYKDEFGAKKPGDKKVTDKDGRKMILRSSVASNLMMKTDINYQGFAKPTSLVISKLSEDHQALLDRFSLNMTRSFGRPYEQNDLLLDYAPYMKILFDRLAFSANQASNKLPRIIEEIQQFNDPNEIDYDEKHDFLLELIDQCDSQKVRLGPERPDVPMYD